MHASKGWFACIEGAVCEFGLIGGCGIAGTANDRCSELEGPDDFVFGSKRYLLMTGNHACDETRRNMPIDLARQRVL